MSLVLERELDRVESADAARLILDFSERSLIDPTRISVSVRERISEQ